MLQQHTMSIEAYTNQPWQETKKNTNSNNHSLSNKSQIFLNSEPTDDYHVATKIYVDSSSENDRNRQYVSSI